MSWRRRSYYVNRCVPPHPLKNFRASDEVVLKRGRFQGVDRYETTSSATTRFTSISEANYPQENPSVFSSFH